MEFVRSVAPGAIDPRRAYGLDLRESVADAPGGDDTTRVSAGLHAQTSDDDIDHVAGAVEVVAPHLG